MIKTRSSPFVYWLGVFYTLGLGLFGPLCAAQSGQVYGTFTGPCKQINIQNEGTQFYVAQFQFGTQGTQYYLMTIYLFQAGDCSTNSLFGTLNLEGTFLMGPIGSADVTNSIGGGDPPANLDITWGSKKYVSTQSIGTLAFEKLCNLTFAPNSSVITFQDTGCPAVGIPSNAQCPKFFTVIQTTATRVYLGQDVGITACTPEARSTLIDPTPYKRGSGAGMVTFSGATLALIISLGMVASFLL